MSKLLTIGMCTFDDFDGVYFSLQSLKMYQKLVQSGDVELIVIDNNPSSPHGKAIHDLVSGWMKDSVKLIPYTEKQTTANRNLIFQNATGKYCVSMDCHVMFPQGSLESLLEYYETKPDCKDIVQGPMMYDNLKGCATHFRPAWGGDMYGKWAKDDAGLEAGKPFKIPMHGLGVFSCETKNWLGFNELFRGFGGEEGYIHEKFRRAGGEAMCVPGFKWLHRFSRPNGVTYPLRLEDRIWNYFVGWYEITRDPNDKMIEQIFNNFSQRLPPEKLVPMMNDAIQAVEQQLQNIKQETTNV